MALASAHPEAPPIDPAAALRAMVHCVSVAMACVAIPVVLVLLLIARTDWWIGFAAATILSLLAAAASVALMRIGLGFGVQGAIAGHFGSVAVRLLIVLGGGVLLVTAGGYSAAATLALTVPYYFATLAGEAIALAIFLRPTYTAELGAARDNRGASSADRQDALIN